MKDFGSVYIAVLTKCMTEIFNQSVVTPMGTWRTTKMPRLDKKPRNLPPILCVLNDEQCYGMLYIIYIYMIFNIYYIIYTIYLII